MLIIVDCKGIASEFLNGCKAARIGLSNINKPTKKKFKMKIGIKFEKFSNWLLSNPVIAGSRRKDCCWDICTIRCAAKHVFKASSTRHFDEHSSLPLDKNLDVKLLTDEFFLTKKLIEKLNLRNRRIVF